MLNILLGMLGFALLHSITADKRVKNVINRMVGQRVYAGFYRLGYNILSVLLLLPILILMRESHTELYKITGISAKVFQLVRIVGGIGATVSLLQIDFLRFVGIRQLGAFVTNQPLPLAPEALKTGGLYGFVRHPLYFFSLLALWFAPSMSHGLFAFNISATLYFVVGSFVEERRMLSDFGSDYADYQRQVPALFPVPRSKSWQQL